MAQRSLKNRRYHVVLKGRTQYMGRPIRTIARLGITWLAALSMLTLAHAQTPEQLRQLDQLSPALRECLLMVVVGELTHQETADTLGLPLGTVLSRVSRARTKLRKALLATVER